MKKCLLFIGLFSGVALQAQKPVLQGFQADQSARIFKDTLWVYPSHDIAGSQYWDMRDWHVFSTTDMVTWKDHGVVMSLDNITWAEKYAWEPDCIYRYGKYYFYFPADSRIGVAVGDSPAGPFIDAIGKPLIEKGESGTFTIDPAVFIDDDSTAYLYFGNGNEHSPRVVKLKPNMKERDGEFVKLKVVNYHEAPWLHKYNGKYYFSYCSYAPSGSGKKDYKSKIDYAVGDSPLGPFEYKGTIIDNFSRNNHHSIVQVRDRWYLFHHVQDNSPYERLTCIEQIKYEKTAISYLLK